MAQSHDEVDVAMELIEERRPDAVHREVVDRTKRITEGTVVLDATSLVDVVRRWMK